MHPGYSRELQRPRLWVADKQLERFPFYFSSTQCEFLRKMASLLDNPSAVLSNATPYFLLDARIPRYLPLNVALFLPYLTYTNITYQFFVEGNADEMSE
jgi:hypothetical protein